MFRVLHKNVNGTQYAMTNAILLPDGTTDARLATLATSLHNGSLFASIPDNIRKDNPDLLGSELVISNGAITSINPNNKRFIPLSSPAPQFTRGTITGLAKAYAMKLLNELNYYWITGDSTTQPVTLAIVNNAIQSSANITATDRWRNTYYWILSAYAVVKHVDGDTAAYTDAQASAAYSAFMRLLPLGNVETWYRAHNSAVWAAYFPRTGNITAYFKWGSTDTSLPDFASDASNSVQWASVTFSQGATIGDI